MEKTKTSKINPTIQRLSEEINRHEDVLSSIMSLSCDEIIVVDLDFNIITRNFKIFNEKSDNVENFIELLEKRQLFEAIETIKRYKKSRTNQTFFRIVLPEGKYIKANITKRHCGRLHHGYLIVLNDYSEEIARLKDKECFIETLMHDLKTPARAEERALELLYDETLGTLNQPQKEMLKEILNSSRYMVRMTDNVLTKLRLETEGLILKKQLNSIKKSVESCVNDIKYMLETAQQTIKITTEAEDDTFIYDEETIKLVLNNLLTNASEYSPKNSTIYISIKKGTDNMIISIRDEGAGISDEKIQTLFNNPMAMNKRFKKVSSGLGLFITKKILEAHNGTITISQNLTNGTEFVITLPLKKYIAKEYSTPLN